MKLETITSKLKLTFIPCKTNKYRPRILNGNFLLYYGLILLILKLAVVPFLFYLPQTDFFADITKSGLFEFSNSARRYLGISPLNENPVLNTAAYLKARHMMDQGYFAHYSPDGVTPWYWLEISGYGYRAAGENLAIGFLESEQVHSAWMDSPTHKKNILNPEFQEMGIAVVKDSFQGKETTLVVQFFGTPRTITPTVPLEEAVQPALEPIEEAEVIQEPEAEEPEEIVEIAGEEEEELEILVVAEEEHETLAVSEEEMQEAFALAVTEGVRRTPAFALFRFMTSDYYNLIQKVIYGSLALIIIVLLITVYCDIFIYRKFKIDYKDAVFKVVSFFILWFILLFLDKTIMAELVNPQNFMI